MKKFFTRSFVILSLISFAIGIYFGKSYVNIYTTLGALLTLVAMLIKEVVPEED